MRQFYGASRLFRAAGVAGATVRRQSTLRHRDRRPRDGDVHRLDEILLLHLDRGEPGDLGAVRLHA